MGSDSGQFSVEFWDVGQGDGSVLHLPSKELIIIDVGPSGSRIPNWLTLNRRVIHALILTHNDADHVGALPAVLQAAIAVRTVYVLVDRPPQDPKFHRMFDCVHAAKKSGKVQAIRRLETPAKGGLLPIWAEPSMRLSVDVRYPSIEENVEAREANETSAIIVLTVRDKAAVVWTGDTYLENVATHCHDAAPDNMVGPHHGAPWDRKRKEAAEWLKSIAASRVVLSVGPNKHKHPQPVYIRKVRRSGANVVCTQLTKLCHPLKKLHDVLPSHGRMGLPPPTTGFCCRGPIRLRLSNGELDPADGLDLEHQAAIRKLQRPKCLSPL